MDTLTSQLHRLWVVVPATSLTYFSGGVIYIDVLFHQVDDVGDLVCVHLSTKLSPVYGQR